MSGMVSKTKKIQFSRRYVYLTWLIAIATFCIGLYVSFCLMESPLLYVPGFIAWGLLSYFAIMALRGSRVFLLLLADGYAILSAMLFYPILPAIGFLKASNSTIYAGIAWQVFFLEVALIFAFVLRHIYRTTMPANKDIVPRILSGFFWFVTGSVVVIGTLVALFQPVYVGNSTIDITAPLTMLGLVLVLIGAVRRKWILSMTAFVVFLVVGSYAVYALLQNQSQGQYLYVITNSATLALAALLTWTTRGVRRAS
jgi:hypothetical protein